jgi:hypothetical protein
MQNNQFVISDGSDYTLSMPCDYQEEVTEFFTVQCLKKKGHEGNHLLHAFKEVPQLTKRRNRNAE